MLMSVSMVVAPWRRFTHVARWNGHAPHTTTGDASANASHIHSSNCSAGIIDSAITGMAERRGDHQPLARLVDRLGVVVVAAVVGGVLAPRVLAWPARAGGPRSRGSATASQSSLGRDGVGVVGDGRLVGGVVHRGGHAVEAVQLLLDLGGARRAGHAGDRQVDARRPGSVAVTTAPAVRSRRWPPPPWRRPRDRRRRPLR